MAPQTRRGTLSDATPDRSGTRFIFTLDSRFSDAAMFGEVYVRDYDVEECPRPSDEEVRKINALVKAGS